MPRFSIPALRWLLVVGNLLVMSAVSYAAAAFFGLTGVRDEIPEKLAEVSDVVVVVDLVKSPIDTRMLSDELKRKRPKRVDPVEVVKPPPTPDGPGPGGPLAKWQIESLLVFPDGQFAFMKENKSTEVTGLPSKQGGTTSAARRRRPQRQSRRRTARKAPSDVRRELVEVGETLDGYVIDRITVEPERKVFYSRDGQSWFLEKEKPESAIEEVVENGKILIRIIGRELTDEEKTAAKAKPGAAVNKSGRGAIKSGRGGTAAGKKTSSNATAKAKAARARNAKAKKKPEAETQRELEKLMEDMPEEEREKLKEAMDKKQQGNSRGKGKG